MPDFVLMSLDISITSSNILRIVKITEKEHYMEVETTFFLAKLRNTIIIKLEILATLGT